MAGSSAGTTEKPAPKKVVFDAIWQDRDIRFDVELNQLRLRSGEYQIERLEGIEDTKGNNGDKGRSVVLLSRRVALLSFLQES